MAFVWRIVNGWPEVPVRMMVCAGALLVVGLGGLALNKGSDSSSPKRLWDYLAMAMAVGGGNIAYRVIEELPVVDPTRAIAAGVLVVGSFAAVILGVGATKQ